MLYITFKKTKDVLIYVDNYFNMNYEDEWFEDELVKQIIQDVDKSTVITNGIIDSPVLGKIPPTNISGGAKALILMLKDNRTVWATACGDNCSKWIVEISKLRDITICLSHIMEFESDFEAICLDNEKKISTIDDYRRCVGECLKST